LAGEALDLVIRLAGDPIDYALAVDKPDPCNFLNGIHHSTGMPTLGHPQDADPSPMNAPLAFIHEIDSTIAQSSADRRADMARHLTDLFLVNADQYSDDEVALIDDVFVRLVVAIEGSSRALLAIRLAPMSKAPPNILRTLACDDAIEVASPILIQSERLDDAILVDCAKTKSQEHLLAISRRKILAEVVTDILVERGDQQVVLSTVKNSGAKFSNSGFSILVKRSDGDDLLTKCVGTRPDLPPNYSNNCSKPHQNRFVARLRPRIPTPDR
jgi:uncharacterized protein (DUF2336 family)